MILRAIVAIDDERGIAKDGDIPWNIPTDTRYYKDMTYGSPIIMGRATYEGFNEPLPGRRNIVFSSNLQQVRQGFELVNTTKQLFAMLQEDSWVIGGAGMYEALLSDCSELYITHVKGSYDCDRFFPAYDDQFTLQQASEWQLENNYQFQFAIYARR